VPPFGLANATIGRIGSSMLSWQCAQNSLHGMKNNSSWLLQRVIRHDSTCWVSIAVASCFGFFLLSLICSSLLGTDLRA